MPDYENLSPTRVTLSLNGPGTCGRAKIVQRGPQISRLPNQLHVMFIIMIFNIIIMEYNIHQSTDI